jgi:hypothetical protein
MVSLSLFLSLPLPFSLSLSPLLIHFSYFPPSRSFVVCMLELANQEPPNRENVKRALYLTATRGLEKFFNQPQLWSSTFEVQSERKKEKEREKGSEVREGGRGRR